MFRTALAALALTCAACSTPLQTQAMLGASPPAAAAAQSSGASRTPQAQASRSSLPNAEGSVKFLVIGDTGTGSREQYEVAQRIVEARTRFPFQFAIMMGDNLYGSEGPSAYVNKFEKPYKPLLDAGVKFYASLGNHDEPAQRFYEPFNMGGKRYYSFRKGGGPLGGVLTPGDVEFFALDSTYMTPEQIDWLKESLETSDAEWKIAFFHHPLYSSGEKHGSELDLQQLIEPLFVANGVDVVFSGHEHFYERIKPQKGIHYITQGGGAKLREGNIRENSPITAKGFDTDQSFTLIEIVDDQMFVETISRQGRVVDSALVMRREVAFPALASQ